MADVKYLAQKTIDRYERVDLLFNNAGVAASSSLWESTINDCKWVIGVNLWGVIHCIREFIPLMLKQNTSCHIVNTSSIAGLTTYHPSALYQLTKHGIVALSEQLHHDLAIRNTKIKVSVLCPGFVNTNIMDAERNRPAEYINQSSEVPQIPGLGDSRELFEQMIKDGMPPSDVAEHVFEAIITEKFFIFTHPELVGLIKLRADDIINARNPVLPPMDMENNK
jgi:NAD(P)-dependent dehydrogenase (short-subunit alcohol dehydrogenase family)